MVNFEHQIAEKSTARTTVQKLPVTKRAYWRLPGHGKKNELSLQLMRFSALGGVALILNGARSVVRKWCIRTSTNLHSSVIIFNLEAN